MALHIALALAAILFTVLYIRWTRNYGLFKKIGIREHKGIFPLGCKEMLDMVNGRQGFAVVCEHMAKRYKDVPMIGYYEFATPVLLINDVELAKRIAISDFDHFSERRHNRITDATGSNRYWNTFLSNLIGEEWKKVRGALTPAFTSGKLKYMNGMLNRNAQNMVGWAGQFADKPVDIDAKELVWLYTLENAATCFFGVKANSFDDTKDQTFVHMAKRMLGMEKPFPLAMRFLAVAFFPDIVEKLGIQLMDGAAFRWVIDAINKVIAERKQRDQLGSNNTTTDRDLIDLTMEALEDWRAKSNNEVSEEYMKEVLIGSLMQFFFVSQEATSSFLSYAVYYLARNQNAQSKLSLELEGALDKNGGKLPYEAVQELPYLDMVVDESLRLNHPSDIERKCTKDYTIPGTNVTVPKGVVVQVSSTHLQTHSEYFPDANDFNPDVNFSAEAKANRDNFVHQPFGAGPRKCIGTRFARQQMKVGLAHLVANFDLSLAPHTMNKSGRPAPYVRWSIGWELPGGMWIRVNKKENSMVIPAA